MNRIYLSDGPHKGSVGETQRLPAAASVFLITFELLRLVKHGIPIDIELAGRPRAG
jgi:hypothetical protein